MTIILRMIHVDHCYPDPHDHHHDDVTQVDKLLASSHCYREWAYVKTGIKNDYNRIKGYDDLYILGAVCLWMSDEKVTSEKFTH